MARYLVTGGAGFIGTNIVRELTRRKQKVVVLDDFSTGKMSNLHGVKDKIRVIKGDVRDFKIVKRACRGVDYILHHAALRAVEESVDDPLRAGEINVMGTLNILLVARDSKVKRVVFASSSAVYGSSKQECNVETQDLHPESPYALSKQIGEQYCSLFSEMYGVETVSLRYFNAFGPYQNFESKYSNVIPILVKNLMDGVAPEIHWHGRQSRDFVYIDNIVQANIQAAKGKNVKLGGVYNIGNRENASINELYNELQKLLNIYIKPIRTPKRAGDVLRTYADIKKAKRDFGYKPTVSFEEGLAKSIRWYQENLKT
jgi:nucleoside-diphosphate-sugar epimerase